MQVLETVQGCDRDWELTAYSDPAMQTPAPFTGTETLSAKVWAGADQAALFSPTVVFLAPAVGRLKLTVTAGQAATLAPGTYHLQVYVGTPDGRLLPAFDGLLRVAAAPGNTAAPAVYCTYQDVTQYLPALDLLQAADADEAGFLLQRARARAWLDEKILTHDRTDRFWADASWQDVADPGAAPAVAVGGAGGSLQAGNYLGCFTWVGFQGETGPSPEVAFTVLSGQVAAFAFPTFPVGATSLNLYLTDAGGPPGGETLYASGITGATYVGAAAKLTGQPPVPRADLSAATSAYEPPNRLKDLDDFAAQRARRNQWLQAKLDQGALLVTGARGARIKEAVAKYAAAVVLLAQVGPKGENPWVEQGRRLADEARRAAAGLRAPLDLNLDGVADHVVNLSPAWVA